MGLLREGEFCIKHDDVNLLADAANQDGALLRVERVVLEVHVAHCCDLTLEVVAKMKAAVPCDQNSKSCSLFKINYQQLKVQEATHDQCD